MPLGDIPAPRAARPRANHESSILSYVLETNKLFVSLGENEVLRDLAVGVERGRFVGLIGPNGSGKTTFLRTAAGLLSYRGSIRLENREINAWPRRALALRLAFVRQFHTLPFEFKVHELVMLGRTPHKRWLEGYGAEDAQLADAALAELEVSSYKNRSVHELSGGELQRVLLAQALVQAPDVLLLDEPTAHLDVHHQYSFLGAVRQQVSDQRTVLAVFHDLELAARFADRLIVLHNGSGVVAGPPKTVLTPDLLSDVFRMRARITEDSSGDLRITYLGTV